VANDPSADALADALWPWWDAARVERDRLPWRSTRDPWSILVAETMLAQTQAARAAERFPELIARFPDARACAGSSVGDVVRAWAGLGYNRRALSLHRAATAIVEHHGGRVPDRLDALLALPGVGPYTARAVLSTAFGARAAVVDTNVGRVLARAVAGAPLRPGPAQRLADSLLPDGRSRDWNLALMDFGALVCRARAPGCARCPLAAAGACAWRRAVGPVDDPATGSAGVTVRQSRFAGSDRQGRGRLIEAARRAPVPVVALADAAGWPGDAARARRIAARLIAEGLLTADATGALVLP
jgi:A/G-specific adenine glycosylase